MRNGFCGYLFLGFRCAKWLLATVEEALKAPVKKDFVSSYREDAKAVMVRGGGNKAGHYLEVVDYAEGGHKGVIWIPKGRKGWGWSWVVGELRQLLKFIETKDGSMGSEAPSPKGKQKRGVSSGCFGGASTSFAKVVRGVVVKPLGSLVPKVEPFGLDLLPAVGCRDVVDGRMAVNYFVLEEQLSRSLEKKKNQICMLGEGESWKKKVGLLRSWKKILEWLRIALEQASASGFKHVGLVLKPKHSSWARPKPTRVRLDLGSLSVGPDSNPDSDIVQLELFSEAVFGAVLGPSYSGSFADRQPFTGGCVSDPVVDSPSTELVVLEVEAS
jgi:hypothetical protein